MPATSTRTMRLTSLAFMALAGAGFMAKSVFLDTPSTPQSEAIQVVAPAAERPGAGGFDIAAGPDQTPAAPEAPRILSSASVSLMSAPAPAPILTRPEPLLLAAADEDTIADTPPPLAGDAPDTMTDAAPATSPLGMPCGLTVDAAAVPGALVALDIMAPCQPEARVVIEHAAMTVTARTDALGLLTLDLPGFETPAFITVRMPDGATESLLAPLPDLGDYDRIGLVWRDDHALQLHAMEFGAAFGAEGHVWEQAPRNPEAAIDNVGGFLTLLGTAEVDDPMLAQVYTLPRASLREGDSVRLSIDAPVTEENCGRPADARTLRSEAGGAIEVAELTFTFPGCDAIGDTLLLQNLLRDLRLASN